MKRFFRHSRYALVALAAATLATLFLVDVRGGAEAVTNSPMHLAVLVEGNVSVKEKGWSNFAPVVFGTALHSGDLLRVEDSAHAKVVCSDLTLHDLETGLSGVPCTEISTLLHTTDGSLYSPTRSVPNDGTFPLVLAPRKTKLLTAYPQLRWVPVADVTRYRITVRGPKLEWSDVVSGTEIKYPPSAPTLEPGVFYKLIVETKTGSSSAEPGNALGFTVADKQEKEKVLAERNRIEALGLPKVPTHFLVANLYASHDLNAEAIEWLEVESQVSDAAAVERLLGDLYLKIGLPRQAESRYLKSLELSSKEKDSLGEMLAHLAVARIYKQMLGNDGAAAEQSNRAIALATELGDHYVAQQAGLLLGATKNGGL